jgi:hypothetical protein
MQKEHIIAILLILAITCIAASIATAQDKVKHKVTLKDSLDGAFDLSNDMIYSSDFLLVYTVITEPSLGGIGGALIPVFLKKRKPVIDTINGEIKITPVNPDITAGMVMYTANKSWLAGLFRAGTFAKAGITYKVAVAYGDINVKFYNTLPVVGRKEFNYNFRMIPVYLQGLKQFNNAHWSAGFQYLFLDAKVSPIGESLPPIIADNQRNSIVSQVGGILQYDNRDNIFTPDKGIRVQGNFFWSNSVIGSDYNSWRINYSFIGYTLVTPKFIVGPRVEGQRSLGKPPFYLLPYINLRGVPATLYQGNATLLSEVKTRWDLYRRWSMVFYGGTGLAYDSWNNMFENPLVYSYGTGFRYLLARKFGLRMGWM